MNLYTMVKGVVNVPYKFEDMNMLLPRVMDVETNFLNVKNNIGFG